MRYSNFYTLRQLPKPRINFYMHLQSKLTAMRALPIDLKKAVVVAARFVEEGSNIY